MQANIRLNKERKEQVTFTLTHAKYKLCLASFKYSQRGEYMLIHRTSYKDMGDIFYIPGETTLISQTIMRFQSEQRKSPSLFMKYGPDNLFKNCIYD